MKKKVRPVPKFRKEQDERDFWNTHDTTDYFDFSKSNRVEIEFDPGDRSSGEIHLAQVAARCLTNLKSWPTRKIFLTNR
jgi:hypothetical protein